MPDRLNNAEIRRRLERAMKKVPRATREVFLAHRLDDMSYREIAERTGLTVRQVERHIMHAIIAMDRSLNGQRLRWWGRWLRW